MKQKKAVNRSLMAFDAWDSSSSVRTRPYAYALSKKDCLQAEPSLWFPTALVPLTGYPEVKGLPVHGLRKLHIRCLLYFLDYTTELEVALVNRAVTCMVQGDLSGFFSPDERNAALKLYTDEGYHALFSNDLAEQVATYFKLSRFRSTRLKHFNDLLATCGRGDEALGLFVMAFISETVITQALSLLTRDELILPVFNMLKDHLHDEARHSVFFAGCFATVWQQASDTEREFIVNTLIVGLRIFCRPDIPFARFQLKDAAVCCEGAVRFLRQNWRLRMPATLQLTLNAIRRTDLLSNVSYFCRFKKEGFIDG
ncbi:diiron oxygenase [Pseudomonas sp. NPDC089401]|uniref:diiron oxygenase n=1 Tax=Pseudomonas sp. NPDC089401 TaxID=3364462 RepID=UPI00381BC461